MLTKFATKLKKPIEIFFATCLGLFEGFFFNKKKKYRMKSRVSTAFTSEKQGRQKESIAQRSIVQFRRNSFILHLALGGMVLVLQLSPNIIYIFCCVYISFRQGA